MAAWSAFASEHGQLAGIPPGLAAPTVGKSGRYFHTGTCPAAKRPAAWNQVMSTWLKPGSRLAPCEKCFEANAPLIAWIDGLRLIDRITPKASYGKDLHAQRYAAKWSSAIVSADITTELLDTAARFEVLTPPARATLRRTIAEIRSACAGMIAMLDPDVLQDAALATVIPDPVELDRDHMMRNAWWRWRDALRSAKDAPAAAREQFCVRNQAGAGSEPIVADSIAAWERLFAETHAVWATYPMHAMTIAHTPTETAAELLEWLDATSVYGLRSSAARESKFVAVLADWAELKHREFGRTVVAVSALWMAALVAGHPGSVDCGPLTDDEVAQWRSGDVPLAVTIAAALGESARTGGDLLTAARVIAGTS